MKPNKAWLNTLYRVYQFGKPVIPRGLSCRELLCYTTKFDMLHEIKFEKSRKLSYAFMEAEAEWILAGSNQLDFHPEIRAKLSKYSDDGLTMSGAYGIPVMAQFDYVVSKLKEDKDSRQAVMNIWKPNPAESKDTPCTLSLQFLIRDALLHTCVTMRSSDVWLGLPYDINTFTQITKSIANMLDLRLGTCYITAGSSHLYEINRAEAMSVLFAPKDEP